MERGKVDEAGVLWTHFEPITAESLAQLDGLRVIVCPATGLDHIDLEACEERGIAVLSLQGETEFLRTIPSTAEHTWALILALVRRIPWAFDDVRKGNWDRDAFQGMELKGKTLGILGMGRVGTQVAQLAQVFRMDVTCYDHVPNLFPSGVENVGLNYLLSRWADILTIHVPLNDETRGMLNEERLRMLPRGSYVVNTSRAEIVDTDAMIDLLDEGHIAGYATDFADQALWDYVVLRGHDSNCLITPHIAGNTKEAREATDAFMGKKLERWLEENPVEDSVTIA